MVERNCLKINTLCNLERFTVWEHHRENHKGWEKDTENLQTSDILEQQLEAREDMQSTQKETACLHMGNWI